MSCEYVREYYGVPADIGISVIVNGRRGVITEDRGNYIGVNFDADKPGQVLNCHPTDGVIYGGHRQIRKMTRSQENYQRYLRSETSESFAEYMGFVVW